ncbi:MAG TPA: hypothetical protein VGI20_12995 [Rhizomicrobium sp.]|jgi:hypothetical protein
MIAAAGQGRAVALLPFAAAALLVPAMAMAAVAAKQEQGPAPGTVVPLERFDGSVRIHSPRAAAETLHVIARVWQIHGRQHIAKFPEAGFLIVHLHSGKVVTVIDGKETQRHGDDFWTVAPGSSMSLRVTSESALVETTAVTPR